MQINELKERGIDREVVFSAVRSSGAGGQNVNKVNSKVELRFNVLASLVLTDDEKAMVMEKLATRINSAGELVLTSQTERSQLLNKELAVDKLIVLLAKALTVPKKRKLSKPTKASKMERLATKRQHSTRKVNRRKISGDE